MKKMKYVIIGVLIVGLVVGYYAYYTHEKSKKEEVELSEVQKIILKDLSGKSYPATPRDRVRVWWGRFWWGLQRQKPSVLQRIYPWWEYIILKGISAQIILRTLNLNRRFYVL